MLSDKNINTPLEFIPSLCKGLPESKFISFLTVSARETLQPDGMTRILPGPATLQTYRVFTTTDGDLELVKIGYLPIDLPTRKITISSWEEYPPSTKPIASLTWLITTSPTGRKKKIGEFTQGDVQNGVFKFLQVAAVNQILNSPLQQGEQEMEEDND